MYNRLTQQKKRIRDQNLSLIIDLEHEKENLSEVVLKQEEEIGRKNDTISLLEDQLDEARRKNAPSFEPMEIENEEDFTMVSPEVVVLSKFDFTLLQLWPFFLQTCDPFALKNDKI